jgi:hypothetical protein
VEGGVPWPDVRRFPPFPAVFRSLCSTENHIVSKACGATVSRVQKNGENGG